MLLYLSFTASSHLMPLLNGKEQHEHYAKHLILLFTEEIKSERWNIISVARTEFSCELFLSYFCLPFLS